MSQENVASGGEALPSDESSSVIHHESAQTGSGPFEYPDLGEPPPEVFRLMAENDQSSDVHQEAEQENHDDASSSEGAGKWHWGHHSHRSLDTDASSAMENTDTGAGSDTETGSSSTGSSSTGSGSTGSTGSTGSSEPTKDLAARRLDSLKGLGFFAGAFLSLVVLTVLLDRCRRYLNNAQATGLPEQNAVPAQAPRPDQIAEAEEPHGSQEQVGELSGDDPCPICQENLLHLDNGNPPVWKIVVQTSCTHAFHYDCIAPWRATHNTCPMCRSVGPFDTQEGPDGTERGPVLITRWLINNRLDDANDEKILHELKIDITAAELEAELEEKKGLTTPLLSGAEDMSPHLEQGEP